MATGAPGTNGVWQYGEDDSEATFSALLNKAASTTDSVIGTAKARITALEAAGRIVQVKSTIKSNTFQASVGAGGNTAITGLSVSITPTSATNKILVLVSVGLTTYSFGRPAMKILRNSTDIAIGDAGGSRTRITAGAAGGALSASQINMNFLDSPATTSATTYSVYGVNLHTGTDTIVCNQSAGDTDNAANGRSVSTITVMEVVA